MIDAEQRSSKHWELTGEGCEIAEQGSHEARVFNAIPDQGMPQSQLMVSKVGMYNLFLLVSSVRILSGINSYKVLIDFFYHGSPTKLVIIFSNSQGFGWWT